MSETYVSIDIETNGLGPGVHSMLQLGAVALYDTGEILSEFTVNLAPLPPPATELPETMLWWQQYPEQWALVTKDQEDPLVAMRRFDAWVRMLPSHKWGPVAIAYPAQFDMGFVDHYLWRFVGGSPFCHGALDIKTVAMLTLGFSYRDARKSQWPAHWLKERGTAHLALDDARDQGRQFVEMLRERGR